MVEFGEPFPTDIYYRTLVKQGEAILKYAEAFKDSDVSRVLSTLFWASSGRTVFVTGVGKSGNIASKIASTLTSTGTPSHYLCPLEALHGGLGVCRWGDIMIILSKSGETAEILDMLPHLQRNEVTIISVTCNENSTLAKASNMVLPYASEECCGTGFIPTTSTTLSLVIGDAIAMSLMLMNEDFKIENFANFHPGGSLGQLVRDSIGSVEFKVK